MPFLAIRMGYTRTIPKFTERQVTGAMSRCGYDEDTIAEVMAVMSGERVGTVWHEEVHAEAVERLRAERVEDAEGEPQIILREAA